MRRMKKTEQILVVVAVAAIAGFFFMRELHDPLARQIKALSQEEQEMRAKIRELESKPLATEQILGSIREITPEVEQAEAELRDVAASRLTPEEAIEETVMAINETAANNGLTVRVLAPLDTAKVKLYPAVQRERDLFDRYCYEVNLSGNFLDFASFVEEVAAMEKIVTLTRLEVRSYGDRGLVDVNLILII
jgi:Tfp pilus assembly protein PilO